MPRLVIDHDKCTGHGRCYALSPTLFDCDDDGYGQLKTDGVVEPGDAAAQLAVDGCPESAISLVD
jgi:ferredoxin